ncbi:hypothetical protein AB0M11_14020 [Streptomyces sp. NPDC051987]|uniref:hypothetical protein n=1 Tax=Streptomyces sp. NPDC051987 TaxID=3155808 RepID=UPI0034392ACB
MNDEHRLIYKATEDAVLITRCRYHYEGLTGRQDGHSGLAGPRRAAIAQVGRGGGRVPDPCPIAAGTRRSGPPRASSRPRPSTLQDVVLLSSRLHQESPQIRSSAPDSNACGRGETRLCHAGDHS